MFIFLLIIFWFTSIITMEKPIEESPEYLTLKSESSEYKVLKKKALQAKTIQQLYEFPSVDKQTQCIEFKSISPATLEKIVHCMQPHFNRYLVKDDLCFKELSEADILVFLEAACLLEFKPAITVAAQLVINNKTLQLQIEDLAPQFENAAAQLYRYHQLATSPNIKFADSIQDLLNYLPHTIKQENEKSLQFSKSFQLISLEGLPNIAFINNIRELRICYQPLRKLKSHTFTGLSQLTTLALNNNEIDAIEPFALSGLSHLESLQLHSNQLKTLQTHTISELQQLKKLKNIKLFYNFLSQANKDAIKTVLPNVYITF